MNRPSEPGLAVQFADRAQQQEAATLGMWVFLMTEVMLFGGLFAVYTIFRFSYPQAFVAAAQRAHLWLGATNTAVLLISSLTMALGVHAAREGRTRRLIVYLLLTMTLGAVFLGIKGVEYTHHFHEHLFPGPGFDFGPSPYSVGARLYFYLYFAMTGLHALHMVIGITLLAVLAVLAHRGRFSTVYHTPVVLAGLYWHLVDIIWIFLFPLFYLIRG